MMWLIDAEARQDQNVDFRMAEEPEQMLVQQRIAATGRIEERRAEVAIGQQHRDRTSQNRQRQKQQERCDQHGPHEQRHLVQRHARRAHVEDGGDEVDRTEDRRRTRKMQRQDRKIHGRTGMARSRQRRIDRPAPAHAIHARRTFDEHRDDEQRQRHRQQPERNVVHAREGHVRRADHQRHEPVAEPADRRRHDHEEHHDEAVAGHEHVVEMRVRRNTACPALAARGAYPPRAHRR